MTEYTREDGTTFNSSYGHPRTMTEYDKMLTDMTFWTNDDAIDTYEDDIRAEMFAEFHEDARTEIAEYDDAVRAEIAQLNADNARYYRNVADDDADDAREDWTRDDDAFTRAIDAMIDADDVPNVQTFRDDDGQEYELITHEDMQSVLTSAYAHDAEVRANIAKTQEMLDDVRASFSAHDARIASVRACVVAYRDAQRARDDAWNTYQRLENDDDVSITARDNAYGFYLHAYCALCDAHAEYDVLDDATKTYFQSVFAEKTDDADDDADTRDYPHATDVPPRVRHAHADDDAAQRILDMDVLRNPRSVHASFFVVADDGQNAYVRDCASYEDARAMSHAFRLCLDAKTRIYDEDLTRYADDDDDATTTDTTTDDGTFSASFVAEYANVQTDDDDDDDAQQMLDNAQRAYDDAYRAYTSTGTSSAQSAYRVAQQTLKNAKTYLLRTRRN